MQNKSAIFCSLPRPMRALYLFVLMFPAACYDQLLDFRESSRAPALGGSAQFHRAGTAGALVCGRFREIVYRHGGRRDRDRAVRHLESRSRSGFFECGRPDRRRNSLAGASSSISPTRIGRRMATRPIRPSTERCCTFSSTSGARAFFTRTTANRNVPQVRVDPATLPVRFFDQSSAGAPGTLSCAAARFAGGKNSQHSRRCGAVSLAAQNASVATAERVARDAMRRSSRNWPERLATNRTSSLSLSSRSGFRVKCLRAQPNEIEAVLFGVGRISRCAGSGRVRAGHAPVSARPLGSMVAAPRRP